MTDGMMQYPQGMSTNENTQGQQNPKMFSQDEVNYLTGKVRAEAYEVARKDAFVQLQASQQRLQTPSFNPEEVVERAKEEARAEARAEAQAQVKAVQDNYIVTQMVTNFKKSEEAGKQKYNDFEEIAGTIDYAASPAWIPLLNTVKNAEDVMYELGKEENDHRYSQINSTLMSGQRVKAEQMLKKFAKSLEKNQVAEAVAATQEVAQPIGQLKPSTANVGGKDWTQSDMQRAVRELRASRLKRR